MSCLELGLFVKATLDKFVNLIYVLLTRLEVLERVEIYCNSNCRGEQHLLSETK